MPLRQLKKIPSKPTKSTPLNELFVAKSGNSVQYGINLDGIIFELSAVATSSVPSGGGSGGSGGSGGTTDHGLLSGLADNDHPQYVLDTGDTMTGALVVDGSADAIQLRIQGHSTQTNFLLVLEDSAGNDQVTVSNDGATVINEEGNDADFRVESDTDVNALYVDASANTVQVGAATASDSAKFYVSGKISASGAVEINGDLLHDGINIRFHGGVGAAQSTGWSVTNVTPDKSFDANSTTIDEIADALGTLITHLLARGDLGA